MTAFVDTAIPMYAAGGPHRLKDPSLRIVRLVREGELDAVTSTEVVQEITHRFLAVRQAEIARQLAIDVLDLFAPVVPITHALIRRVPDLARKYPAISARDLVHVATCIHEGITDIISPDHAFDQVMEVRRIDPTEFAADPA